MTRLSWLFLTGAILMIAMLSWAGTQRDIDAHHKRVIADLPADLYNEQTEHEKMLEFLPDGLRSDYIRVYNKHHKPISDHTVDVSTLSDDRIQWARERGVDVN